MRQRPLVVAIAVLACCAAALLPACGGGSSGGSGTSGGLILVSFSQAGQDNVPLNQILRFQFSSAVDPDSITPASIQIREGSAFGATVPGTFRVNGASVSFEPRLPGLCDLSDAGLRPATPYRITLVGYPEEFAVRAYTDSPGSVGDGTALDRTSTYNFTTRSEGDPALFEDQIPGVGPEVLSSDPDDGSAAVAVPDGNSLRVVLSENVDPCTVNDSTVLVYEYERGNIATFQAAPNGNASGFVTPTPSLVDDATPGDPYTWGATNGTVSLASPQKVRATISLQQSFGGTEIRVIPEGGRWPDNALIVAEFTFGIRDLGGLPLVPHAHAFTTANLPVQAGAHTILWEGETPVEDGGTTADVNSSRAPSKAQGYLLFAGDGDNGTVQGVYSKPGTNPPACTTDRQVNDGVKDSFDPTTDVTLDTGATANQCDNSTDGSKAVVWEFGDFRIRSGVTVRVIGVNPAIILVQGDVLIENGGRLLVRGDGGGGSPQGRGANGNNSNSSTSPIAAAGGVGVAGGGRGGNSTATAGGYGQDGTAGFGSPNAGVQGGLGAGQGNASTDANGSSFVGLGVSPAGGGAGHAVAGAAGSSVKGANEVLLVPVRGAGGGVYPTGATAKEMLTPSAGSGGGAAGYAGGPSTFVGYDSSGGAGAAGGGFVDITSSGDILIFGTLDAAGSRGGNGAAGFYNGSGGDGGGSGGGIRLLTPNDINLLGGTVTAAGGGGGSSGVPTSTGPVPNPGGNGGSGRIVLEDGDSVVTGLAGATMSPSEGQEGFFRSTFNAARFKGGGLTPQVLTELVFMGPTSPSYLAPTFSDFPLTTTGPGAGPGVGIPPVSSRGIGSTGVLIEARGYPILPDGEPNLAGPVPLFYTVGYFTDSGQEDAPNWTPGAFPADIGPRPVDNAGDGITNLNGLSFLQLRITFFLPNNVGPFDPGPYINTWVLRFNYDQ